MSSAFDRAAGKENSAAVTIHQLNRGSLAEDAGVSAAMSLSQDAKAGKAPRNPAKKMALVIVALLLGLVAWYAASDRMAPYSSKGAVAAYTTQLGPQVAGKVVSVSVSDNQAVKAGTVLFQLDPRPFELAAETARANLEQARQSNAAAAAALASSEARVTQARAALENTLASVNRTRSLATRGLAAESAVNDAEAGLVAAQTALQVAEADLVSARLKVGNERSNPQIEVARLQLEQAELNLQFTSVTAPSDGVITNLRLAPGQYIATGAPALTFISTGELWISVDMRENQLALVRAGLPAEITLDGQPGRVFEGRVQSVAWGIDTGRTTANGLLQNQASTRWFEPARTIPVRIELARADDVWPENTRVGSKASVVIHTAGSNNPVSWIASGLLHIQSILSFLY
jgi:multidrug resistance efflux pump